jgi:pilus assembly protein FimV
LQVKDVELQSLQQRIAELELQSAEEPPLGETPFEIDDEAPESDTEIVVEGVDELSESPFADDAELLEDDSLAVVEDGGQVQITPVEEPAQPRPDQVVALADDDSASFIGGLLSSYWLWGAGVFVVLVALFFVRRRTGSGDADATSFWEADEDVAPDAPLRDFSDLPSADTSFVVDEVDDALAEDLAEPAPVQEPEPEAEPIFDEAAETVIRQAFDDEASPDIDESEPQAEQASEALDDVIDFDDFDSGELTTNLEVLQAANADADQDDDSETPLEKTISAGAPLNLDQADPIAEAEFHMAYGLYDQAADLLVKALDKEPDNREQRVKLVEVYFVWENREGFLAQATALREAISDDGDADWNKVLILGKQLCPEAELFSGAAASSPTADAMDLELGEDVGEMDLDFALGGTGIKASEGAALADDDAGLDLDIGAVGEDEGEDGDEDAGALDLDLSLGGTEIKASDVAALADDDAGLDLNIGAVGEDESEDESEHEDVSDLDLSLAGTEIKASDVAALADDDAGLDLNIGADTEDGDEDLAQNLGPEDGSLFAPDPGGDEGASVDDAVADDDGLAVTTEAPTLESPMLGGEAEPPALDIDLGATDAGSTMESPTLQLPDSNSETAEMRGLDESVLDATALDDPTAFNVDLSGLADFEEGSSVDIADDEPTVLAKTGDFSKLEAAMDSDTVEQPRLETSAHGDTAEQPEIAVDDLPDLDDSASIVPATDEATMTEVGTKLDLARAYVDMGDPDGARSILSEVLDEGSEPQQQEARQILEELAD